MDVLVLLISLILLDGRRGAASRGRRGGASGGSTPVRRGTAWWRQRRCDGGAAKRRKSSTLALALGMTDRGWRNDASGWAEEEEASWRDEPLMLAPDRLDALGPYVTGGTAGNDAPRIDLPAEDVSSLPRCSALVAVAEKEMGGSSGANMAVAVTKPFPTAMEYWQKIFPETPMPPAILDLLTPLPTVNMPINFLYQAEYKNNNAIELYYFDFIICPLAVWNIVCKERMNWATLAAEGLKEVSVSYGSEGKEEPKKAFPMGRYMLDKEREMTSRIDKEDLREVSVSYDSNVKLSNLFPTGYAHQKYILTSGAGLKEVSVTYGSDGEEEPRKTFSQVGYMLDKERKKSSDVDEEGLKEVMVSYGSNGKEETSKTTPMGGYMVHMKNEKSLQAEKDGLKEVSVSYGSNGEEETSKTFAMGGFMVDKECEMSLQGEKEGLKEVSVSYGSEGKEEPRKAFPMGRYMLDKKQEMTSRTDKDGLREVSVSYESKGEVVTRKAFPMERYVLDKEPKRNLHRNKDELREVSVLYGSKGKLKNLFPTGYGHKKHKHANEAELKEVSVSYGSNDEEKPRKAFLRGGLFLGNEYEKSLHIDKEDLKEVSVSYGSNVKLSNLFPTGYVQQKYILTSGAGLKEVSVTYGSDGEEEPRKTFSKVGYMLDKECKKSSDVDEGGLKEVSVSYGSNGEEETSKTTPMGGYMVDMKNEKSLQADKEELKEVSVSYGSDVKLGNLFPIEHKKYVYRNEDGLKEVSVSYGSNGEEETSKTFAMGGYMVDKERGMSLQGQKEGLKEASVSYGSNDEEETRKIIPMKGYMVDWEHEKSLQAKKGMDHGRHVHAHGNKMQQLADVFFFRDALRPGSVITPTIPPTTSLPAFLPRHVADAIPFSADRFADVLAMFAPASLAMAREIRWALDTCGQRAAALLPGEKAGCATSLESLADLAASLLGTRDVSAFSAADLPTDTATTPARRGRYNVTSARELSAMAGPGSSSSSSEPAPAAVVACHDLTYPYAVFYCHSTEPTAAYAVTLVAATTGDGDGEAASPAKMEALAVCHLDTSRWRADNPFFVAHGVKPGEVSVCHFLTKLSIVWVPRHEQGAPRAAA
uniref:BURP domain-containing protein n=1 Tax=Oryza meridionalis TaxID=40149 RepID=A0A0E0E164_9ORYZ